jgi:hypothetical protein
LGTLEDMINVCFARHLLLEFRGCPFPDNSISERGISNLEWHPVRPTRAY